MQPARLSHAAGSAAPQSTRRGARRPALLRRRITANKRQQPGRVRVNNAMSRPAKPWQHEERLVAALLASVVLLLVGGAVVGYLQEAAAVATAATVLYCCL